MKGFVGLEESYSFDLLDEGTTLSNVIDNHIHEHTLLQSERNAFFVADLGSVVKQNIRWQNVMTQVKPFYTVKCNTSRAVIEVLAALGTGFACGNKNEIAVVQSLGVASENIIYTNPCKQVSQIKYAAKKGVNIMSCDNDVELLKIARNHPSAKLLVDIATTDSSTENEMSMKFGATLKNCRHLLESAKKLGIQVVGVRFHVSTLAGSREAYLHGLADARCVFDMAEEFGFNMNFLDIGGGFSGTDCELQLEKVFDAISPLLDIYFPPESGIKIIAEPGSYYVNSAFTLAVNIVAKKVVARDSQDQSGVVESTMNDEPFFIYYISDGVYGSFANNLYGTMSAIPILHKNPNSEGPVFGSSLWGPSCDGLDQVVEHCLLPELNVGDWVIFENMGAYTLEQSAFSEFQRPPVYCVMSINDWFSMQEVGLTLDTSVKNFSRVPSCFQLRQEQNFSAAGLSGISA
ncbi:antizyme inhibitor 1 [Callorhinchus milii]|uniref:Antizyme inhibitor 1 n=1 Tax=Callorhinchus milii TaxID=7868 RepID=A0A4W3H0I4_CALMI|nr:antizyme inhibitor 1 [Callorhinchus milii]|eukprot:gi/632941929/ref/XP_007886139.1/ PREDICTED: antizyme inhibitor 1 [Callorhinchus milii]